MNDYFKPEHQDYTFPTEKELGMMSREELIACALDLRDRLSATGLSAMRRLMTELGY